MTETRTSLERRFPCGQCGARLEYAPGTTALVCPYCDHHNEIEGSGAAVDELDFKGHLRRLEADEPHTEVHVVRCESCGAETTFDPNVTASVCAWCGVDIIAQAMSRRLLTPKGVLPFRIDRDRGMTLFRDWVGSRWFAPNALKKMARNDERLQGVYIPFWTYDSRTTSRYTGERGDDYWVTQTYTAMQNGRRVTRTRQVRRTRWRPASGTVRNTFDDVLVLAATSVPRRLADALEPWDLQNIEPYQDEYLTGFRAESYSIDLDDGFDVAEQVMEVAIRRTVRRDIGGDHQRIRSLSIRHQDVTFKHILLPIWVSTYRYRGKSFQFLINGRTGEVQGERPYSGWKIAFLVLFIGAVIATVAMFHQQ